MNSKWDTVTIAEIAARHSGSMAVGPFGSRMKADLYVPTGVRVIRGNNLSGGREPEGDYVCVSEQTADSLATCCVKPGDLVFPHRGNIGQVGITPNDGKRYMLSTSLMKLSPDRTKADPLYLMYFFKSSAGRAALLMNSSQVGTPGIATPLKSLKNIQIPLPPLETQREISEILGTLDDQIALLREANKTHESIAQTLFKSWFVDFDPVQAKREGRDPAGMDRGTASLFPDQFENIGLEIIPAGWQLTTLGDAYAINPSRQLKKGSVAPYLEMAGVQTVGHTVTNVVAREFGSGTKFRNGDSLLARITPCLENGKSAFVDFLSQDQVGWGSTEFVVLRPNFPLPEYHGYLLCRHDPFRAFAIQSMSGTSGRQRIQKDVLSTYRIAVPPECVAQAFSEIIEPIRLKIAANHDYVQTLITLRDTLLPRLISGQLKLPNSELDFEDKLT